MVCVKNKSSSNYNTAAYKTKCWHDVIYEKIYICSISIFLHQKFRRRISRVLKPGRNSPPSSDGPPFYKIILSCISKSKFLHADTAFVYFLSGQCPDIKKSTLASSENEVFPALVSDFIK